MGLHDTLEKVLSLYEAMAGTAERAEQAPERAARAVKRMEGFEARVAGLVRTVNETAQTHEARLKEAYRRLEKRWIMRRAWCSGLAECGYFSWSSCAPDSWG